MREVAMKLEIQESQHVYLDYSTLQHISNLSQDETIAILERLLQRMMISPRTEKVGFLVSNAHACGNPTRQPRGPPYLGKLVAKPTSEFERSKNFVTSQREPFWTEWKKAFTKGMLSISAAQVTSEPTPKLAITQTSKKERSHEGLDNDLSYKDNPPPPYADIVSPDGTRHSSNAGYVPRKRFLCVDISHDKHLLSHCEDCTKGKKYYSFYRAALHLRQDHLKNQAQELEGRQPSTEVLKQWITEIEELVPEHLAPYDDFNYIEDDPQVQPSKVPSKRILPVLATESQSEKMINPKSARTKNETPEASSEMTDGTRDEAVSSKVGWEVGFDPNFKHRGSLSREFRSDERDTKSDTLDLVGEGVDADYMTHRPRNTEAIAPNLTKRRIPLLWSAIASVIITWMLELHLNAYLYDHFSSASEPYQTRARNVTLQIFPFVLVALDLGFQMLVFSREIFIPRHVQITKWEWNSGIYHFELFLHALRMRIDGRTVPMVNRCRIESCPPDEMRHSPPCTSTKLATMYKRSLLATWAQVRMSLARLTRGRPISTQKKRIYSQCRCGHRFFDDYLELKDGAAVKHWKWLQRRFPLDRSSDRQVSGRGSSLISGTSNLISSVLSLIDGLEAFGNHVLGRDGTETSLPQYRLENTSNERPRSPGRNGELLFLLLCVPHRQYATKLLQPQISAVRSDKDFFRLLRVNYQQMRGRVKRTLSLKTLRSIKFVQLELYKSELVDIRKQDDMPPEVKKDEYRYNPVPAEIIPPVGENHMLHLIKHPSHAEEDGLLLERIPKKLKERLLVCPSRGTGLGWGIYFIEGWHISVITLVVFAIVLAGSLAFLICWSVLKHDVQGASGVAAYMIAFLGLTIGSVQAVFEIT